MGWFDKLTTSWFDKLTTVEAHPTILFELYNRTSSYYGDVLFFSVRLDRYYSDRDNAQGTRGAACHKHRGGLL